MSALDRLLEIGSRPLIAEPVGSLATQIRDVPDGGRITFKVIP